MKAVITSAFPASLLELIMSYLIISAVVNIGVDLITIAPLPPCYQINEPPDLVFQEQYRFV